MSIELLLIIYVITCWAAVSFAYWDGWRARDRQRPLGGSYGAPRRRGSNPPSPGTKPPPPSGPPQPLTAQLIRYWTRRDDQIQQALTEGRTQRGNGNGGPTTPKPQFPPGRVTDVHGRTIGYRPIPSGRDTIPPPRNP